MNMHSNTKISGSHREEEGLAILVRCHSHNTNKNCIEIKRADYLLLPRLFGDKQDDHQRIMQHVTIIIAGSEGEAKDSDNFFAMDFYNTHLSLSLTAREKSFEYFKIFDEEGDLDISTISRWRFQR